MNHFDVIIIGGGMAGSSAAYELSKELKVLVLEQEMQPGYHATGRSAAVYSLFYGSDKPAIFALTKASNDFFETPPAGFAEHALRQNKSCIMIGHQDKQEQLEEYYETVSKQHPALQRVKPELVREMLPVLKDEYCKSVLLDPEISNLDVHALQGGFLKFCKHAGGSVKASMQVDSLSYAGDNWHVQCKDQEFTAPVVVNAAGAWADEIAGLAQVRKIGLQPMRRTAILIDPPEGLNPDSWPMVAEFQEAFYFKPDAGKIMVSPADETPSPPCDAQPDELDIAYTVEHIENATTIEVKKINHSWAGLRSFVKDRSPVIGFDSNSPGFFWLAGQGGYGIQTSPAAGRLAAALIMDRGIPEDIAACGLEDSMIAPNRKTL